MRSSFHLTSCSHFFLNIVGFIWEVKVKHPSFEDRLEQCREFRRKHGHLNIPPYKAGDINNNVSQEEKAFAQWAERQRNAKRLFDENKKCCLDKSRIKRLDELGFEWNTEKRKPTDRKSTGRAPDKEGFEIQLNKLRHVKAVYGSVNDMKFLRETYPGDESLLYVSHFVRLGGVPPLCSHTHHSFPLC